jgi:hypothetical protein
MAKWSSCHQMQTVCGCTQHGSFGWGTVSGCIEGQFVERRRERTVCAALPSRYVCVRYSSSRTVYVREKRPLHTAIHCHQPHPCVATTWCNPKMLTFGGPVPTLGTPPPIRSCPSSCHHPIVFIVRHRFGGRSGNWNEREHSDRGKVVAQLCVTTHTHTHTRTRTHAYIRARMRAHTCNQTHVRARARACKNTSGWSQQKEGSTGSERRARTQVNLRRQISRHSTNELCEREL